MEKKSCCNIVIGLCMVIIVLLLVLMLGLSDGWFIIQRTQLQKEGVVSVQTTTSTVVFSGATSTTEVPFNKQGTFVFNNPGYDTDSWYLIYDEQGSSGRVVKLVFDKTSVCSNEKNEVSACTLGVGFESGARVIIEGTQRGNIVAVSKLIRLKQSEN